MATGFECEFVEKPPEALQSLCPMCDKILREPYQAPCCGKSFCRVCIERIQNDNEPCPNATCREETQTLVFHNKGLQNALYGYQVFCSHKQEGCEWKGELGQLDNHLNLSPQPDKQLEGCEYSEIECIYCSESFKRSYISAHQNDLCPKRPIRCEYCNFESHYEEVTLNHLPVCGYHPVRCPNECGTFPQRQALENHVTRDCPNTVIDCDFHHVGCDVRLPRKDMTAHLKENLVTHVSLQAASYSKLLARVQLLENALKQSSPTEFTMDNFEQHKENADCWFSPPFYTHPGGYKFCLGVYANGYGDHWLNGGKGTHVSLFFHLMKGEFDDDLKWPFRGKISIQLVDQRGKGEHHTETISFDDGTPDFAAGRVTQGEKNLGAGKLQVIAHHRQIQKYLKNDCLRFKIIKAKTYSK